MSMSNPQSTNAKTGGMRLDGATGNVVLYTATSDQSILFGTSSNSGEPIITVTGSNVYVNETLHCINYVYSTGLMLTL